MPAFPAPPGDAPAWWVPPDPGDAAPAYLQLARGLRERIEGGALAPGSALPAERELAARLGVSRATLRQALEVLGEAGLVRRQRGSGTFVRVPEVPGGARPSQQLGLLSSFADEVRSRGGVPGARVLAFSCGRPVPEEVLRLALSPSEEVYRIRRLRCSDGEPLALEESTLPAALTGPLTPEDVTDASLYALLGARGLAPARALRRLRAQNAGEAEAALLGLAPGAALLSTQRVSWLASGRPIEYARALYRGDRYDFVMELYADTPPGGSAP